MNNTSNATDPIWQIPPEMLAALDAANARLAELSELHSPANQVKANTPPRLVADLLTWGHFTLKPAGEKLLTSQVTAPEFFETLLENDCLADARRVLAHSMAKRRALWWGVLTAWDAFRSSPPADLREVLSVITQYVISPTEDLRRAAGEWSKRCRANTLAACLATATYCSAGSISPPGLPPVAPRPFITGRLVGVAVYLAAVTRSPALYKQYLREYLRWGRDLAHGTWALPQTNTALELGSRLDLYWAASAPHVAFASTITNVVGVSS